MGVAMLLRDKPASRIEDRLDLITGANTPAALKEALAKQSVLSQPLNDTPGFIERFFERFGRINMLFEQADTSLTISKMMLICAGLRRGRRDCWDWCSACISPFIPLIALMMGLLADGLAAVPAEKTLETVRGAIARGHGNALPRRCVPAKAWVSASTWWPTKWAMPIGKEFNRVFEEQNLGIPMEQSLREMTERIPNLDLKFFVTAVILQRQTGGDLAEILDKIGELIRDRFRIWGQVQALTGEGRLSGIVLLALPFALFFAVYYLNPKYLMVLFTDPMGTKMLVVAIVMQLLGALVIRKIVNIKV